MTTSAPAAVRDHALLSFHDLAADAAGGNPRWLMRSHNFWLEWIEFDEASSAVVVESRFEMLVIVPRAGLRVGKDDIPGGSVCILPAGRHELGSTGGCVAAVIASERSDAAGRNVLNAEGVEPRDPRIEAAGRPFRRRKPSSSPRWWKFDAIKASADKPRLKMLQTETLSINLVAYLGPRDRGQLSPHSHASFEQGSLAIEGDFVHHLRTPWGSDADAWRDDLHLRAPSPSMLVVPVEMIHTTEGVGDGAHCLIDVFSPPRGDFIAKGWVFNSSDYLAQDTPSTGQGPEHPAAISNA